jgi:putative effector of murein hydrolase LrgA (UPF0299 family)
MMRVWMTLGALLILAIALFVGMCLSRLLSLVVPIIITECFYIF